MQPEVLLGKVVVLVLGLNVDDGATATFFRLLRSCNANALKALKVYL